MGGAKIPISEIYDLGPGIRRNERILEDVRV
jgi:hypothetical protein